MDLAKDAIKECKTNKDIKIVASLGPYASYKKSASEYVGVYDSTDDEILNFHINNLNIIRDINYEIILYETIPCLREIKILSMIFEKLNKEIWVSMTCDDDINFRDGSSISEACNILSKYDSITTIGLNCFSPLYVKEAYEMLKNNSCYTIIFELWLQFPFQDNQFFYLCCIERLENTKLEIKKIEIKNHTKMNLTF